MMLDTYKTSPGNLPYILASVAMAVLGVFGVVLITLLRPTQDNTTLIATVLGFLAPTTLALLGLMKAQETKLLVNGRLDGMIEAAKTASFHEGRQSIREETRKTADVARELVMSTADIAVQAQTNVQRSISDAQTSIEKKIDDTKKL